MHITQFTQHTGIVLPLNISNIDTDNIIPKQFLKAITRTDFGKYLFFNWRYIKKSTNILNTNFILNNPSYKNASILLTRRNFGCGSSREHAVWALIDYGFRVIIAPSFATIFYKNSFNNQLLLAILSEEEINSLFEEIEKHKKGLSFTVHVRNKTIRTKDTQYSFQISKIYQNRIIKNVDRITVTLKYQSYIQEYEDNQPNFLK